MTKCRSYGDVITGLCFPDGSGNALKTSAIGVNSSHRCSRGHNKTIQE
ncbi:MAG: hypothetical protein WAM14_20905 [Candidatus Nitrosopolaris sp.]